jgi:hypothetical protein
MNEPAESRRESILEIIQLIDILDVLYRASIAVFATLTAVRTAQYATSAWRRVFDAIRAPMHPDAEAMIDSESS